MPDDKPLSAILTAVSPAPLTACVDEVPVYEPLDAPYWKNAVVASPVAFAVPLSVAPAVLTPDAAPVTAVWVGLAAYMRLEFKSSL